jgi:hypothetical protein
LLVLTSLLPSLLCAPGTLLAPLPELLGGQLLLLLLS